MFTVNELPYDGTGESELRLGGEIDTLAAESVLTSGVLLLDRHGSDLTIDLADVSFIDSTGLGALVGIRNHALQAGRAVRVVGARDEVQQVFRITGLDEPFGSASAE